MGLMHNLANSELDILDTILDTLFKHAIDHCAGTLCHEHGRLASVMWGSAVC
jgi:hypothetical protein